MAYNTKSKNIHITLPSDNNYWVDIDTDFRYGDVKNISPNSDGVESADKFLSLAIKDWNIDDESGNKLEVNQANIDLLRQDDVVAIIKSIEKGVGNSDEKKDSSK
jgi:hypothetical protein